MDQSDDLLPRRRALFVPVVIATVFLSLIGVSAGLLLGARQKAEDRRAVQQAQQQPAPTTGAPVPRRSGPSCRSETRAAAELAGAAGPLVRVLRLRTRTSVVYICADEAGALYYHANNGGDDWIEGKTALFLTGVTQGPDGFRVTAGDGTVFTVTEKRLFIEHKDGRIEEQRAT